MLHDKLKKYSDSGIYPFHMPGHKRNLDDDVIPYKIDLTEIFDFDNLHCATGCIKDVENKAAQFYSVKHANILINGATGGILAAVRAMTNYGDKVIVARNCHKSVYNAIELCGLNAEYILPHKNKDFGIFASISPEQVESKLKNTGAKLVILTSPTYEGVVSDIKPIADICKKYGAKLFVDEAHGAHFPLSSFFPREAVSLGADAAVVSLHKTLPALTQTALLLTDNSQLSKVFEKNLAIFETSSPSYVLMSSIENCFDFIDKNNDKTLEYVSNISSFRHKCKNLKHLKLYEKTENDFDYDFGKIVISTRDTNINGVELSDKLRKEYQIELEMAYTDYVIAMTSVCDTKEGFDRLSKALSEIDSQIDKVLNIKDGYNFSECLPVKAVKSSDISFSKETSVPFELSSGRVSAEYVWAYPPGIPLIVSGEVIDNKLIKHINYLSECGVEVYSTNRNLPTAINVVEFD